MRKLPDKKMPMPFDSYDRHLYGFKTTARIKDFLARRKGMETVVKWELVKADGTLLTWLHKRRPIMSLYAFYATWPDAKVAWAVYKREKEISE